MESMIQHSKKREFISHYKEKGTSENKEKTRKTKIGSVKATDASLKKHNFYPCKICYQIS